MQVDIAAEIGAFDSFAVALFNLLFDIMSDTTKTEAMEAFVYHIDIIYRIIRIADWTCILLKS